MQGCLGVHTFTPVCVRHAGPRSEARGSTTTGEIKKRARKAMKHRWRISDAFWSPSKAPKNDAANNKKDGDQESDVETFVSADSAELLSTGTDDGSAELPSLPLSPPMFPATGTTGRPPSVSPVNIVTKLPFGYVIGRQPDSPSVLLGLTTNIKKVQPMMATLHLRSRTKMVKNKVARALNGAFRRSSDRRGGPPEEEVDGNGVDEDVFWKKDVRGRRCRPVEDDDDALY
jgi:hypothetical protein